MFDFPSAPTLDQEVTLGGSTYVFNGQGWLVKPGGSSASSGGDFYAVGASGTAVAATPFTLVLSTVISGNSGGWYDAGRYTPPAGRYHIFAAWDGYHPSGPTILFIALRKNGSDLIRKTAQSSAANVQAFVSVAATVDSNGSDWFDIQIYANATATMADNAFIGAFPI